jgi:hypothetical protein
LTPDQDFCLDIAYWKLEEGNIVNFVGGDWEQWYIRA